MKKLILSVSAVFAFGFANAQDKTDNGGQTAKGKWLIEANTGFGAAHSADTAFGLSSVDGETAWSIGAEGGYFIMDDLAIKAGLGYNDMGDDMTAFSYKVGAKYYILSQIPVQVDYSGASYKDADENPSYLGIQGGYAIFLGPNVSIEPGLRFNKSLNDDFYEDVFQVRIGFALHF
ncbi:hypothetical protein ACFPVY_08835 [Flavobacterium qiangtangense]|uniref:Outer membrane protein beta-barrel domain-containing protein n=1 Tax=Flavobacterium qiangtangense TaxID=1442595 RepID=A0ABW1PPI1_9FLAO